MLSVLKKVGNLLQKVLLIIIVYAVVIHLFFYFFKPQNNTLAKNSTERVRQKLNNILNSPKLVSAEEKSAAGLLRSITCFAIGDFCEEKSDFRNSFFGFISSTVTLPLYNQPASGIYWVYSGLHDAGFVPKAYAAEGIGFAALAPFRSIWLIFRNFVFLIMVLVIIAIGFMIMFRSKINPQTVISVENSLPKIVITLILVTFSYAIAGFLIDIMYISIGFIFLFFQTNSVIKLTDDQNLLNNVRNLGSLFDSLSVNFDTYFQVSTSILNLLPNYVRVSLDYALSALFLKTIISIAGGLFAGKAAKLTLFQKLGQALQKIPFVERAADKVQKTGTIGVSLIAGIILLILELVLEAFFKQYVSIFLLSVILMLSIVFIFFRIFFMLLRTYIEILFLVIFSPLILMLEAIPGKSSFSSWIKNLLLNLSVYPILVTLTLVADIILSTDVSEGNLWQPPYLSAFNPQAFQTLIGALILFSIPDLVKTVKKLSGVKPLPVDIGIGSFFAGAQATGGGIIGTLGQFSSINFGLQAVLGQGKGIRQIFLGKHGGSTEELTKGKGETGQ